MLSLLLSHPLPFLVLMAAISSAGLAILLCPSLLRGGASFVTRMQSTLIGRRSLIPTRACRYCRWGRAKLVDATVKVEADDLVEIECFVCGSCGLPQWSVKRSPVLRSVR